MRAIRWILVGSVAAGASARVAEGQVTVDPVTTTGVSGFRSSELTWLAVGVGYLGLQGVAWSEDGDKPCWIQVFQRALTGTVASSYTPPMDICGTRTSNPFTMNSTKTVSFSGNARHFVRGVAVCNNNRANHRLKGIRIYPAKVWTTREQIDELNTREEDDRTNCAVWHSPVYCPADNIATAFVVHHSDKEITGLALRCRRAQY